MKMLIYFFNSFEFVLILPLSFMIEEFDYFYYIFVQCGHTLCSKHPKEEIIYETREHILYCIRKRIERVWFDFLQTLIFSLFFFNEPS